MTPFNLHLMDVRNAIVEEGWEQVTSPMIREPSTTIFHPDGFFSERIFGSIATPARMVKFGYLYLNCRCFHPIVFQNLKELKGLYVEILACTSYATWDEELCDFERASMDDPGASTGFVFFLQHFDKIKWRESDSLTRKDKIDILKKYKRVLLTKEIPVIPAGVRDIKLDATKMEKDTINNLYLSLLNITRAMPDGGENQTVYNTIHWSIQRKVNEIYSFLQNIVNGKKGYFAGKYAARSVAYGTRNVITAANMTAKSVHDPQAFHIDETKVPLYLAAKGLQPLLIYGMKHFTMNHIMDINSDNISVIDPKTLKTVYVPITEEEKNKLLSSEGIIKFIDQFENDELKFKPVTIHASNGKEYYPYMVYDKQDTIYIVKFVQALEEELSKNGETFEPACLRPMTSCELLYILTYVASKDKYGTVTRYPIEDEQSIYISKCHLMSTLKSRIVTVKSAGIVGSFMLPNYPIIGSEVCGATMLHPTRLQPLKADFDGDTTTWIPIFSNEGNMECKLYTKTIGNYVRPNGAFALGFDDLTSLTLYNLTMDPVV